VSLSLGRPPTISSLRLEVAMEEEEEEGGCSARASLSCAVWATTVLNPGRRDWGRMEEVGGAPHSLPSLTPKACELAARKAVCSFLPVRYAMEDTSHPSSPYAVCTRPPSPSRTLPS